jgi:hypothetical protein
LTLRLARGKGHGYIPETYALFRAAKYCGVPPWELEQQSIFWMNHALEYEAVENEVEQKRREDASKAAKRRRGS